MNEQSGLSSLAAREPASTTKPERSEPGPGVGDGTSVFIEGTGDTTTTVTLDTGLWTAASHVDGDGAGQFTARLIGSSDSARPACWDQGRGVLLADIDSDNASVYNYLPLVVADTDDAWCEAGHFTLEITATSPWIVVLTSESPPSGDESDDDYDDREDDGGTSPGAVLVNDVGGTVEILGDGDTETTVTLGEGLWTAASSVQGNKFGRFVVRLRPPAASASTRCKLGDRGVILANSGQTFIDSTLPVLIGSGPDAWCGSGEFTLEVSADDEWSVTLVNDLQASDRGDGGLTVGGIALEPPPGDVTGGVEPTNLVFVQISVGDRYACGVTVDRAIECWGSDNTWRQASPPAGESIEVAAGGNHTCALTYDGRVQCWGDGYYGQTAAPDGVFTQVIAGRLWSCALRAAGSFKCWGSLDVGRSASVDHSLPGARIVRLAENGKCGLADDGTLACWYLRSSYGEPTQVVPADAPAGTFTHVGDLCGVRVDGTVTCWGANPPDPSEPLSNSTFVATSDLCGVTSRGSIECWGTGQYGRANEPEEAPDGQYTQVSAGDSHACGLRTDGGVRCWGGGYGDGPEPPLTAFAQVSVGSLHPCGVTVDGKIECWDRKYVGAAPAVEGWRAPEPIKLPGGTFIRVSVGGVRYSEVGNTACAVGTDGTLACWDREKALAALGGEFSDVFVGTGQTCAVRAGGAVECWAWDEDETVPSPAPADRFTQVSATSGYACGVRIDSTLACWGTNERWPAAPPAGTFSQVSVGSYRACAVGTDARLVCWTWTASGLGELAEAGIRAPADPPAGAYMGVSVAGGYACGLMTDGSAACWGAGTTGRADPPDVSFAQISAGPDYACGVRTDGYIQCWGEVRDCLHASHPDRSAPDHLTIRPRCI